MEQPAFGLAAWAGGEELSTTPPFRVPAFPPPPTGALTLTGLTASQTAMAIEYVSSPVPHPALQIRIGAGPSADLRLQSWGNTCFVNVFKAPGWRKNPLF